MKFRGILLLCALVPPVVADEGMWLFNQFPPLTYRYREEQARAVHVASQGIVEALRKVCHATGLMNELGAR
jgi:hypothetical protein